MPLVSPLPNRLKSNIYDKRYALRKERARKKKFFFLRSVDYGLLLVGAEVSTVVYC